MVSSCSQLRVTKTLRGHVLKLRLRASLGSLAEGFHEIPEDAPKNSQGSHGSGWPPSTGRRMCGCSVPAAPWDGAVKSTHPDRDPCR
jgi:hypothetical protein